MERRIRTKVSGVMQTRSACMFAVVLFLSLVAPMLSQTIRSEIFGKVFDPSGAVLTDVEITATNLDNNSVSRGHSGSDGTYVIPSLLPGKYKIEASKAGFATQSLPSFDLLVDARSQVDFNLHLAGTQTSVTVNAQASAIETGTADLGQVIQQRTITDLPLNGRDFLQLVLLSPGASPLAGSSDVASFNGQSVNISGGRESSNQLDRKSVV